MPFARWSISVVVSQPREDWARRPVAHFGHHTQGTEELEDAAQIGFPLLLALLHFSHLVSDQRRIPWNPCHTQERFSNSRTRHIQHLQQLCLLTHTQQLHEPERIMNILHALEHQNGSSCHALDFLLNHRPSLVAHALHGLLAPGRGACAVVVVHQSRLAQKVSDAEECDRPAWWGVRLERLSEE